MDIYLLQNFSLALEAILTNSVTKRFSQDFGSLVSDYLFNLDGMVSYRVGHTISDNVCTSIIVIKMYILDILFGHVIIFLASY